MGLAAVGDNLNYNIDKDIGEVIETYNDMNYEQRERDLQIAEKAEQEKWEREKQCPYKDFTKFKNYTRRIRPATTSFVLGIYGCGSNSAITNVT